VYVIRGLQVDLRVKVVLDYNTAAIHFKVEELLQNNPTFIP